MPSSFLSGPILLYITFYLYAAGLGPYLNQGTRIMQNKSFLIFIILWTLEAIPYADCTFVLVKRSLEVLTKRDSPDTSSRGRPRPRSDRKWLQPSEDLQIKPKPVKTILLGEKKEFLSWHLATWNCCYSDMSKLLMYWVKISL